MKKGKIFGNFVIKVRKVGTTTHGQCSTISIGRSLALTLMCSDSFLSKHKYKIEVDGRGDIYITEAKKENEKTVVKDKRVTKDKRVRIKQCGGGLCPYLIKNLGNEYQCGKVGISRRRKKTTEEIPKWCPLEDYDE